MVNKRGSKSGFRGAVFGLFLALFAIITPVVSLAMPAGEAYAEDNTSQETFDDGCQESLGKISWWICPMTEKVADAVDWLYEKIQDILLINPVEAKDGAPLYEIWKYCRSITNVVFIIFLLIVIYSQLTGLGISNYGIKRVMPKLIVVAILVNLSFLICTLAVDISNIVGMSLRGVFSSVEQTTLSTMAAEVGASAEDMVVKEADMFSAIVNGGTLLGTAAAIAFEAGTIWMMIPAALGAIVAVVTGLITIALRQAVVALLVMVSPLAVVAYMLPNTENLFKKWRKLLTQMLVFYPMFSLLFGAASLAGFAIIAGATDGFGLLLGTAVQIFPLFFSWKLMQMSGTFLGTINTTMRSLTAGTLAKNREWAGSHRDLTKQNNLNRGGFTPSLRLMQFMDNRRIGREADLTEAEELRKNRALANRASRNWKGKGATGAPTRRGRAAYARQAQGLEYLQIIERDKNTMNKGLGYLVTDDRRKREKTKLEKLDARMVNAADRLKIEQARGEQIEYENAVGYHKRMEKAVNAHFDDENAGNIEYRKHDMSAKERASARARYASAKEIMEGDLASVQFAAADAAYGYDVKKKIIESKMGKYFELTPPTRDVMIRLDEMTTKFKGDEKIADRIDMVLPGLRTLNMRGDTDLVRKQIENVLNNGGGVDLGSHSSQALASFLMTEVKDNDPFLRRFGKYINLETAHVYNMKAPEKRRHNASLTLDEYVTGEYEDWDRPADAGNPNVPMVKKPSRKSMTKLMEGTSLDRLERTAYANVDAMLRNAYTQNGQLDVEKYLARRDELGDAIGPAFISACLKYPSGSEQLTNAVSFLTGYNGDVPVWDDPESPLYRNEAARKHFQRRTMKYLEAQTPSQIFGLRSDFKNALMEHLLFSYTDNNPYIDLNGLSEDEQEKRGEYIDELAEIQTKYDNLPPEEAWRRRRADEADLKKRKGDWIEEAIGAEFRALLDSNGVLNQMVVSRKSGAANSAKHWVRGWSKLDDQNFVNERIAEIEGRKESRKRTSGAPRQDGADAPPSSPRSAYSRTDVEGYIAKILDLERAAELNPEGGPELFFKESMDWVMENLSNIDGIQEVYQDFYNDQPNASIDDLAQFLVNRLWNLKGDDDE